jgi:hypothetical protein
MKNSTIYVRYGTLNRRGKFHILVDKQRYDGLCGVSPEGLSPCTATSEVLAQVGWLNSAHICKRCLRQTDEAV